jgi:hypothetical protein
MSGFFKKFKVACTAPLIGDMPPELAQCETGCRVGECAQGKWLACENRIARMQGELAAASSSDPGSEVGTS